MPHPRPVAERFWEKVAKAGPDDCWLWTDFCDRDGYGRFRHSPWRTMRAHRIAWMLANGVQIDAGIFVCHTCDNPSCVNPAHLWLGTCGDNARDMAAKGRAAAQRRTHCLHGHPLSEDNTAITHKGHRKCRICVRAYWRRYRQARKAAA